MRQFADETDGVGQQQFALVRQNQLARRRIKRGEKFVFNQSIRSGESVQKRGFSRIGVADNRGERHCVADASFALDVALTADGSKLLFELPDAVFDHAAVVLNLFFTFAACSFCAAALTREVTPCARETGQKIFAACEFHLKHGFAGLCSIGENVKNDLLTIYNVGPRQPFQIALLRGAELRVENNQFGVRLFRGIADLFRLAGAEVKLHIRNADCRHSLADDLESECADEFAEFVKVFTRLKRRLPQLRDADQIGARLRLFLLRLIRPGKIVCFFLCQIPRHVFSI